MNPSHTPIQPRTILAARFASFVRRRTYRYASLQELANRTRQYGYRLTDGDIRWVQ